MGHRGRHDGGFRASREHGDDPCRLLEHHLFDRRAAAVERAVESIVTTGSVTTQLSTAT